MLMAQVTAFNVVGYNPDVVCPRLREIRVIMSHFVDDIDLPLFVDRTNPQPLQLQIVEQLRQAIHDGQIVAGFRLPSTRSLATSLNVSRNVVISAYDELYAEGYTEGRHGSGTFIVDDLPPLPVPEPVANASNRRWLEKEIPQISPVQSRSAPIDFRLGQPSTRPLPSRSWRQIWREMATLEPPDSYGPPEGLEELRAAIAAYLGRSRGIACTANDVLITSGSLQAVDLIARGILNPGDSVAFEEPGYPVSRVNLQLSGATIAPIKIDADGLVLAELFDVQPAPKLVYITPSHQYPTGARIPVANRFALLEWARVSESLIIEDDYDSEFRFNAMPLPALASLDSHGDVVYIGTFSKVLTPALRIGYIVATKPLLERLILLKRITDFRTSWPVQKTLATLIESGKLESHIRQMRRRYAEKRALLGEQLASIAHLATFRGLEAGLHVMLELVEQVSASCVVEKALQQGVNVSTLDEYYLNDPDRNALLLGYGGLSADQIVTGCRVLVSVISEIAAESAGK